MSVVFPVPGNPVIRIFFLIEPISTASFYLQYSRRAPLMRSKTKRRSQFPPQLPEVMKKEWRRPGAFGMK